MTPSSSVGSHPRPKKYERLKFRTKDDPSASEYVKRGNQPNFGSPSVVGKCIWRLRLSLMRRTIAFENFLADTGASSLIFTNRTRKLCDSTLSNQRA